MKILVTSQTTFAGVVPKLAAVMNKYTEHEARCVCATGGTKFSELTKNVYNYGHQRHREAVEWADVVHCIHTASATMLECADLIDKKIWVYQWAGTVSSEGYFKKLWPGNHEKKIKLAHIGQGGNWHPFYQKRRNKTRILPNIIDIYDEDHQFVPFEEKEPVIGFFPAIGRRLWIRKDNMETEWIINKKQEITLNALSGLPIKTQYRNRPFKEVMKDKGKCQFGIDQLMENHPYWNLTTFEYLSKGTPCFITLDDYAIDQFKEMFPTKYGSLPFINVKLSQKRIIKSFLYSPDHQKKIFCETSRNWMETYYQPKKLIQRYIKYYEE